MLKYAPFVIVLASATPLAAQIPATATPQVKAEAKADPLDKIVCRREEGTGSRLDVKKVCMSLRDWKDQADDARRATERIQQNSDIKNSG